MTDNMIRREIGTSGSQVPVVPVFDPADYLSYMDDLDIPEEEKIEFLRTLWNIMAAFVNWGFGVDSVIPLLAQKAAKARQDELRPR